MWLSSAHWRRFVKNIGWANPNIDGQNVVKTDKCIGVSRLLGARAGAPPKVYAYTPAKSKVILQTVNK